MQLNGLTDEDFVNYKKPSMFLAFPRCSFKCEVDAKCHCCQNSGIASAADISVDADKITDRYLRNSISKAVVCGGLEPFDSASDLFTFIKAFRDRTTDDIVIYTGYTEQECKDNGWLDALSDFENIIVKFGRYIPNQQPHFDPVLGVNLASDNQYAKVIGAST